MVLPPKKKRKEPNKKSERSQIKKGRAATKGICAQRLGQGGDKQSLAYSIQRLLNKVDISKLDECDLVFFEELWQDNPEEKDDTKRQAHKIAEHKDLEDKDQTISVEDSIGRIVVTGDSNNAILYGFGLFGALMAVMLLLMKRRKEAVALAECGAISSELAKEVETTSGTTSEKLSDAVADTPSEHKRE